MPGALMWRKLGIEPGEERVFTRGVTVLFLVGWATVFLGNLSVTLFNKRIGSDQIADAFLLSAFVLFGTTGVFGCQNDDQTLGVVFQGQFTLGPGPGVDFVWP